MRRDVGPDVVPGHGTQVNLLPALVVHTVPTQGGSPPRVQLVQRYAGTLSLPTIVTL